MGNGKDKAKAVGWTALYAGITFTIMMVISLVLVFVTLMITMQAQATGISSDSGLQARVSEVLEGFSQGNAMMVLNVSVQFVWFACFGTWYYLREKKFNYRPNYKKSLQVRNLVDIAGIGFLGQYALNLVIMLTFLIFPSQMTKYQELMENLDITAANPVLMIISVVILGPLVEELIFRGMIFGRLRRAFMFWPAAIISSLLFGIYHMNLVQGIYATVFGLMLAYVFEKTETIWGCFLLHLTFNGCSYLISWYEGALADAGIEVPVLITLLLGTVSTVAVVILARRLGKRTDIREEIKLTEPGTEDRAEEIKLTEPGTENRAEENELTEPGTENRAEENEEPV